MTTSQPPTLRPFLRGMLLAAAAALVLASLAAAQAPNAQVGTFGTRVKVGDTDYLPLTKRASTAVRAMEWDAGVPGDVRDNCILLLSDTTDGGPLRAVPPVLPAPQVVQAKDLRLTACQGKAPGTPIADTDVVERLASYVERAVEVRYADANGNGKYDRADPLYLTTVTGTTRGLVPSTGPGAWTVRLTPVGVLTVGAFVVAGDSDLTAFGPGATGYAVTAGTGPAARTWSLTEREGNGWYLVPVAAGGLSAQAPIPVNSLRIGLVGVAAPQPAITVSNVQLPTEPPAGGETLKLNVKYSNEGGGSGVGLLVTRLGGTVVDARLTPFLGPGEAGQAVIPVALPLAGGELLLQVGDAKVTLDVAPGEGAATSSVAALEARLAQLEQQLAEQPAPASQVKKQGAPGLSGLAILAILGLALVVLRRTA